MKQALIALILMITMVGGALGQEKPEHKFWDRENRINLALLVGVETGDLITTRRFLAPQQKYNRWLQGQQATSDACMAQLAQGNVPWCEVPDLTDYRTEWASKELESNPIARPFVHRGLAGQLAYFYGINVGGVMVESYLLHRTNHHKLERWLPRVQIGMGGIAFGWNLRNGAVRLPSYVR